MFDQSTPRHNCGGNVADDDGGVGEVLRLAYLAAGEVVLLCVCMLFRAFVRSGQRSAAA